MSTLGRRRGFNNETAAQTFCKHFIVLVLGVLASYTNCSILRKLLFCILCSPFEHDARNICMFPQILFYKAYFRGRFTQKISVAAYHDNFGHQNSCEAVSGITKNSILLQVSKKPQMVSVPINHNICQTANALKKVSILMLEMHISKRAK